MYRVPNNYNQDNTARARRKHACCTSSRETASALARTCARYAKARCALEAVAGTSHHGLAPKERGLSSVQWPCIGYEQTTTSAARRARVASTRAAPTPERQQAQWRARAFSTRNPAVLEAAGGTSHYGLAPNEKDVSPVRWTCMGYRLTTTSAAWRARVASMRAAPPPERQLAQWRAGVRATRSQLCAGACGWHIEPWPCAEGERPLVCAVALFAGVSRHH